MDRRRLPGLTIGVIGLAFGMTAAAESSGPLAVMAAVCALVAGGCSILADRREAAARAVASAPAPVVAPALDMPPRPILDPETGLPDERYFGVALEERVAAARRHLWPTTVLLLELEPADENLGIQAGVTEFASLLRQTLRQSDVACRLDGTRFGVILEDTAETGGVWSAERLQLVLTKRVTGVRRMAAGVASYPTHGLAADTILARAREALGRALDTSAGHGLGQVEVAVSDGN
jgi:diguanylate cyclase (GGDEF)-like protein